MTSVFARLAAASLLAASLAAAGAAGDLDAGFGAGGIVLGPPGSDGNEGVVIDRTEGIVFVKRADVGASRIVSLHRLRANGAEDATFGTGGDATLATYASGAFFASGLALDGRRLVAVSLTDTEITVRRFSEGGALDAAFGTGGVTTLPVDFGLAIIDVRAQPDSKVLIVTTSHDPAAPALTQQIALFRLTASGVLDATFGSGGVVYTAIPGRAGFDRGTGLALQADGKIVVVGRSRNATGTSDPVALRYLANGTLDATFATGGVAIVPFGADNTVARRVLIGPDGKITAIGTGFDASLAQKGLVAFRLDSSGNLDLGFGAEGRGTLFAGGDGINVARQSDDKLVAVGAFNDGTPRGGAVHRLTAFGTRDTSWDGDGLLEIKPPGFANAELGEVAIDSHDRIVIVGGTWNAVDSSDSRWFVARLDAGRMITCR
jgi:uncharacterized delta-60 repeat protein